MSKEKEIHQQFIFVCNGKDCKKNGCKDIQKAIKSELKRTKKQKTVKLIGTKCTGKCKKAPVIIAKEQWMTAMDVPKALEVVKSML
ncbi:NADH:ubiquinone oxidoreductase subunit E [Catalinimonas alkaloidigena]|uniref:(2Fe-2S) ferredoxin domain-containing protein n=1 Tax=Catalinimonas alkaloidigena TaxID=1075417 RepID=UPI0024066A41|nr:(2Fe-2S) ferredoxin domain-containing protein [Catalinimonas alkaloidigena]MDF9795523.1 NADH:ubiquinone oxidoreductase subunit E [Catalinimonas alkaloidigena]